MSTVKDPIVTPHQAKTAALVAYESGALSVRGRARLEKHLAGCETCRRELAAMSLYDASLDVIRDTRAPDVDWSKMELALEREAHQAARTLRSKRGGRSWLVPALGVALAAAAVLGLTLWPGDAPNVAHDPPAPIAPVPAPIEVASSGSGRVTLVAGPSHRVDGAEALAIGAALDVGTAIATDEGGTLHAVLSPSSASERSVGLVLASLSELHLLSLDDEGARLGLDTGRMTTRTRGARTVILAGAYRIEADVAWFVVDVSDADVRVDVREGEVRVIGPETDRTIQAPQRFASTASDESEPLDADDVVGMDAGYPALPRLRVARAGIVRWQIGDAEITGASELAMRVRAGEVAITGWDARGRELHAMATIGPDGLDLAPDELRPIAPRVRTGTLPTAVIRSVVSSHQAGLTRCYERALRTQPDLAATVLVEITVDMTGEVSAVHLGGDPLPAPMAQCLAQDVDRWTFPAPDGGPMTFAVPMPFTTGG